LRLTALVIRRRLLPINRATTTAWTKALSSKNFARSESFNLCSPALLIFDYRAIVSLHK
jgi:hypothetical protein